MRIPSGKTDQLVYFVAVDSTDLKTRETGLSTFTVYRSRNGGAATVYTTPTVAELSAANMPGVYVLTIDEDTTIAAGSDSEEYCVHITQAAMAPVTRTIELYRRDTTTGRTLSVDASSRALSDVDTIKTNPVVNAGTITFPTTATLASTTNITAGTITTVGTLTTYTGNTPQTGDAFARLGAPAGASVSADILAIDNFVDDLETRIGTPTNLGSGATISANLVDIEGQTDDIGVAGAGLTNIGTIATVTNLTNLPSIPANWITAAGIATGAIDADALAADAVTEIWAGSTAPTAAVIADAVLDEDMTAHQTQGTLGQAIGDPVADTNTIYKAVVTDATGATVGVDVVAMKVDTAAILIDTAEIGAAGAGLTALATQASVDTVDANVDAILLDTGTTGVPISTGGIAATSFAAGAINAAAIAADAIGASELAQDAAREIADEVLDRNIAGGGSGNTRNVRNSLRAIRNLVSESGGTLTIYQEDDVTPAWTATVTRTAATNPITAVDPT